MGYSSIHVKAVCGDIFGGCATSRTAARMSSLADIKKATFQGEDGHEIRETQLEQRVVYVIRFYGVYQGTSFALSVSLLMYMSIPKA